MINAYGFLAQGNPNYWHYGLGYFIVFNFFWHSPCQRFILVVFLIQESQPYWLSCRDSPYAGNPCLLAFLTQESEIQPCWHSRRMGVNLIGASGAGESTLLTFLYRKVILIDTTGRGSQPNWHSWYRKVNLFDIPNAGKSTLLTLLAKVSQSHWLFWRRNLVLVGIPEAEKSTLLTFLAQDSQPNWRFFLKQENKSYRHSWYRKVILIDTPDREKSNFPTGISGARKSTFFVYNSCVGYLTLFAFLEQKSLLAFLAQDCQSYWCFWRRWISVLAFSSLGRYFNFFAMHS